MEKLKISRKEMLLFFQQGAWEKQALQKCMRLIFATFSVKSIDWERIKVISELQLWVCRQREERSQKGQKDTKNQQKLQTESFKEGMKVLEKMIEWVVPTEMLNQKSFA